MNTIRAVILEELKTSIKTALGSRVKVEQFLYPVDKRDLVENNNVTAILMHLCDGVILI